MCPLLFRLPKRFYRLIITATMLLYGWSVAAQPSKQNLAKDLPFFQRKSAEYTHWLDKEGLGKVLAVHGVRMRPQKNNIDSTELELILTLRTTDNDEANVLWKTLKKGFDSAEDTLEQYLYRIFVHKMEIPGAQGSIHIYTKNRSGDPIFPKSARDSTTFRVWIWQEPDARLGYRIASEAIFPRMKSKEFTLTVKPPEVKTASKSKGTKVVKPRVKTANETFDVILKYMRDSLLNQPRYRTAECNDRRPYMTNDSIRLPNAFSFTITDLGREVMTHKYRSSWEQFWGYNSIPMERLSFRFEYIPVQGGFTLKCTIEGKYGSGVFKPRNLQGYMNMEPDFDSFFETYKNKIRLDLEKRL